MSSLTAPPVCFCTRNNGFENFCVDFLYFFNECRQQRAALHFWQLLRQQSLIVHLFLHVRKRRKKLAIHGRLKMVVMFLGWANKRDTKQMFFFSCYVNGETFFVDTKCF